MLRSLNLIQRMRKIRRPRVIVTRNQPKQLEMIISMNERAVF